ncbi:hypothetical protein ACFE04_023199 [Oxalis oulophora]
MSFSLVRLQVVVLLLIVIDITFLTSECEAVYKMHVRIVNNLDEPDQLDFRCQSRGRADIGPILLETHGQYFQFDFEDTGNTEYICDLWYPISHRYHVTITGYPYDTKEYYDNCDENTQTCTWEVNYEGIYDFEGDLLYTWGLN